MNKNKKRKGTGILLIALIVLAAVCVAAAMAGRSQPAAPVYRPTVPAQTAGTSSAETTSAETTPTGAVRIEPEEQAPINLGYGLEITDSGRYTGLYMEDGSNELVSDVMMIVVRNNGDRDFQLANITAVCGDREYHFTLTNLAVGARAVLLDLEREAADGGLESAILEDPVLFEEPMELYGDTLRISGAEGMLNVQNISETDIDGDIHVYYKYAAEDIYYGGITFRVRLEGGLKAGELRQLPAGHYSPDGCAIVQVTIHG